MTLRNIVLGVALTLSYMQLFGQSCVRLIRTKYDSAQNNEMATYYPNKVNPWLSTFDYAKVGGAGFSDIILNPTAGWVLPAFTGGTISMVNPFSSAMGTEYLYLQLPTLGAPVQKDTHWEDGWELMWMNTGYYPNGEAVNTANPNRILTDPLGLSNARVPYIILYNRYQGKLRVFANLFTDFNQVDSVKMIISYPTTTNKSGIFRHLSSYDQPLDEPSQHTFINSINFQNKNNHRLWWSSDFQLGYDPCVCEHESTLEFEFKSVKDLDINLFGRTVGQQQPINAFDANFLTNESILNAANQGKGGSLLFKSFDKMINDYDHRLLDYNTRLESYNSPFNSGLRQILAVANTGVQNAGGGFVTKAIGDIALRSLTMIDGPSKKDTATSKEWAAEASKAAKGQLAKGFDFLAVANFGKEFFEAPQRPTMPTASFSEMRITGSITDLATIKVATLLTPGSYKYPQDLTPHNYPVYNNAVGLFALLRKPNIYSYYDTVQSRSLNLEEFTPDVILNPSNPLITQSRHIRHENWQQDHKFNLRFKSPLKYKLNRALDFDDNNTNIYVSFVVELENLLSDSTCFNNFAATANSNNFFIRDILPSLGGEPNKLIIESVWKDVEDVGEVLFDGNFTTSFNTQVSSTITTTTPDNQIPFTVQTDFLPCFNGTDPFFRIKKVKMKIAADMYFNQKGTNGLQNNTFQSFTYLLFDENEGVNLLDTTSDSSKITLVKVPNLVLTNETIETTDPFVHKTEGNIIYVNAERIELNGNIDVQSGYKAELHATKSIKAISGNTNVSNKIRLRNVSAFSNYGKNYETTQSEVDAFCQDQNNGYKALVAANKTEDEAEEPKEEAAKKIETSVYPNPATDVVNVAISENGEKEYNFQVFDIMGRSLVNENVKGANQPIFEINTSNLSGGTYFLRITTPDGAISETHRIVILK